MEYLSMFRFWTANAICQQKELLTAAVTVNSRSWRSLHLITVVISSYIRIFTMMTQLFLSVKMIYKLYHVLKEWIFLLTFFRIQWLLITNVFFSSKLFHIFMKKLQLSSIKTKCLNKTPNFGREISITNLHRNHWIYMHMLEERTK